MPRDEIFREWESIFAERRDRAGDNDGPAHPSEDFADVLSTDTLSQEDVQMLAMALDEYSVEFPPESVIQHTIEVSLDSLCTSQTEWQPQTPARESPYSSKSLQYSPTFRQSFRYRITSQLEIFTIQVRHLGKWVWVLSLLLFVMGFAATLHDGVNPYKTVLLLSPMPFVLGALELARDVDSGMAEIELASRISLPQLILSRTVLVGTYNVVLNTAISLVLYSLFGVDLWRVVLLWLVPFTYMAGLMLYLATKFRGTVFVPASFILWAVGILLAFANPRVLPQVLAWNEAWLILGAVVGILFFAVQVIRLHRSLKWGIFLEVAD